MLPSHGFVNSWHVNARFLFNHPTVYYNRGARIPAHAVSFFMVQRNMTGVIRAEINSLLFDTEEYQSAQAFVYICNVRSCIDPLPCVLRLSVHV